MKDLTKRFGALLIGTAMLMNFTGCNEINSNEDNKHSNSETGLTKQEQADYQLVKADKIKSRKNSNATEYDFYSEHQYFYENTMKTFMQGNGNLNVVYSPVNVYIALGMLARCTAGEAQQQILDLLGDSSIDEVRENVKYLFEKLTVDEENCITELANSIWLSADRSFKEEVLKELGEEYYTSSFSGEMGSNALNEMLHDWINDNTNDLLKEQVENFNFTPDTVAALVSTIYFKVNWLNEFKEDQTYEQTFYADAGEIELDFMHNSNEMSYFVSESFTAISLATLSGSEWYFLPNDGYTNEDILNDPCLYEVIGGNYDNVNYKVANVIYSIPKLDVDSQLDLIGVLTQLGVKDVFVSGMADFSPLIDDPELYVSKIIHGARLINDETGVEAAAYTAIMMEDECVAIPVDNFYFDCNKPYVTVITEYGTPIFTSLVNNPQG